MAKKRPNPIARQLSEARYRPRVVTTNRRRQARHRLKHATGRILDAFQLSLDGAPPSVTKLYIKRWSKEIDYWLEELLNEETDTKGQT